MDNDHTVVELTQNNQSDALNVHETTEISPQCETSETASNKDENGWHDRKRDVHLASFVGLVPLPCPQHNLQIQSNIDRKCSMCLFVFIVVFFLEIAVNYDSGAIPAVLISLKTDFKISDVGQGLLGSLPYIGLVIASPFVGRSLQTFEPKKMLLATLGANLLSTILLACSYYLWMLYFSRWLIGFTQAGFAVYAPVWVDEFAPEGKMTMWMGLTQGGVVLGTMLGYLIAGFFRAGNKDWRWAICIQCILLFILIILFAIAPAKYINVLSCRGTAKAQQNSKLEEDEGNSSEGRSSQFRQEERMSCQNLLLSPGAVECFGEASQREHDTCLQEASILTNHSVTETTSLHDSSASLQLNRKASNRTSPKPQVIGISRDTLYDTKLKGSYTILHSASLNDLYKSSAQVYQLSSMHESLPATLADCQHQQDAKFSNIAATSVEIISSGETVSCPDSALLKSSLFNKRDLSRNTIKDKPAPRRFGTYFNYFSNSVTDTSKKPQYSHATSKANSWRKKTTIISSSIPEGAVMTAPSGVSPSTGRCFTLFTASPSTTALEAMKISSVKPVIEQHSIPESEGRTPIGSLVSCLRRTSTGDNKAMTMKQSAIGNILYLNSQNNGDKVERGALASHGLDVTNIKQGTQDSLRRLLMNPIYVSVTLSLCALFFEVTSIQFWSTRFFEEVLKVEAYLVLVTFSSTAATAPIFGVLLGGILIDKLGGYKTDRGMFKSLVACSILAVLCLVVGVVACVAENFIAIIGCIWIILFLGGGILPPATGIIIAAVDSDVRPLASGFSMTVYNVLGYILGTFLPGALIEVTGLYNGMRIIFVWSFFGFAGIAVATCFAWKAHYSSQTLLVEENCTGKPAVFNS